MAPACVKRWMGGVRSVVAVDVGSCGSRYGGGKEEKWWLVWGRRGGGYRSLREHHRRGIEAGEGDWGGSMLGFGRVGEEAYPSGVVVVSKATVVVTLVDGIELV